MCIIVSQSKKSNYTLDNFEKFWSNNSDGMGVAYWNSGQTLTVRRHLDKATAKDVCADACKFENAIFHFRFATNGAVTIKNCHPFVAHWSKKMRPETMVFHNGVHMEFAGDLQRSDSKAWTKKYIHPLTREKIEASIDLLGIVNGSSRTVILHGDGTIHYLGGWYKVEDGIWTSTDTTAHRRWSSGGYTKWLAKKEEEEQKLDFTRKAWYDDDLALIDADTDEYAIQTDEEEDEMIDVVTSIHRRKLSGDFKTGRLI